MIFSTEKHRLIGNKMVGPNTNVTKSIPFLCMAVMLLVAVSACKKLVASLFGGQTIVLPAYTITVPEIPISDSTIQFNSGNFTTYVNTDSLIRAQNASFNINDVSSIKVTGVSLTVTNADAANNLSALRSMRVTISSSANATSANMFIVNIPAYAYDSFSQGATDAANIVGYLHGTTINNTVYGTVRKTTSKTLTMKAVITMYAK